MEPQLEDPVGKLAAEAVSVRVLPLPVHDLKGDVLVRRARVEPQNPKVLVFRTGFQEVLRRGALVDQIWVEDVELVTLNDLGRGVVEVVMRLVVFVPLEARVDPVEEARFSGTVLVRPQVHFPCDGNLHAELGLVVAHALFGAANKGILGAIAGVACNGQRGTSLGLRRDVLDVSSAGICCFIPVTCSSLRASCSLCRSSSGVIVWESSGSSEGVSRVGLYRPES